MQIGRKKEKYNDLNEINNLLKLSKSNCTIKSADFRSKISEFINPCVDGKFIPLLFELRGNYEVTAIGSIDAILDFFKLSIVADNENGFDLGIKKEGETEIKRNPKAPKYFANICKYDRVFTSKLKRDYFNLSHEEHLYFYRSQIILLNEEETVEVLKSKEHYENFNKFAIHTIRKQRKFHKIFNLPYKLNINVTLIPDCPRFLEESSLSFKIEEDNSISLSGTLEHVNNLLGEDSVNITFNIQNGQTAAHTEKQEESKWSIKNLLSATLKNSIPLASLAQ